MHMRQAETRLIVCTFLQPSYPCDAKSCLWLLAIFHVLFLQLFYPCRRQATLCLRESPCVHRHTCMCQHKKEKEIHGAAGHGWLLLGMSLYGFTNDLRSQQETAYKNTLPKNQLCHNYTSIFYKNLTYAQCRLCQLWLSTKVVMNASQNYSQHSEKGANFIIPTLEKGKLNFSCRDPSVFFEWRPKPWNSMSPNQLGSTRPEAICYLFRNFLRRKKRLFQSPLLLLLLNEHNIFVAALKNHNPGWIPRPATCRRTQNKPSNAHIPWLFNLLFWQDPHICQGEWFIYRFNFKTGLNIIIYYRVRR